MSLQVASFLWPGFEPAYEAVSSHIGNRLGRSVSFRSVLATDDVLSEPFDAAFLCGLPLVQAWEVGVHLVPLAAPVPQGERYGGRPVYFSDVIVRSDHSAHAVDDLAGAVWAFNEETSQSGWNVLADWRASLDSPDVFDQRLVRTGAHKASMLAVLEGQAEAAAIDSVVWDAMRARDPEQVKGLRVVHQFGPSPIQPLVVREEMDTELRSQIRDAVTTMGPDQLAGAPWRGFVEVAAEDYEPIRTMWLSARKLG